MKRASRWLSRVPALAGVALLLLGGPRAVSADGGVPPEVQERLQRLNGLVEDLLAAQSMLQKRLAALNDEIHAVREEGTRSGEKLGDRFASREEVRRLAESLREIDRKREEDKRLILEEIKKLAQAPIVLPARDTPRVPPKEKDPIPDVPAKGYKYVIKSGDTLSAIALAYVQSGVKVTVEDILKANPNLKPSRLPVGQEVFIPDPNLK